MQEMYESSDDSIFPDGTDMVGLCVERRVKAAAMRHGSVRERTDEVGGGGGGEGGCGGETEMHLMNDRK